MLFKRALTVIFLLPAVIFVVIQKNNDIFVFSLMVVLLLAIHEYCNLASLKNGLIKTAYIFTLLITFYFLNNQSIHFMPSWILAILVLATLWWLSTIYLILSFPKNSAYWHDNVAFRLIIGFLVFMPMLVSLSAIHRINSNALMLLLSLVWAADCGGYFFGKAFGKNKLCPNVSPGKTIEGVLGGVFLSSVIVNFYLFFVTEGFTIKDYFYFNVLSIIVVAASVAGDLLESAFKRLANAKDSGNLLPGHGGVFDRIDSLTAAAPFFFLFYIFIT
jgi:phosphatidate cytidylyltransferase